MLLFKEQHNVKRFNPLHRSCLVNFWQDRQWQIHMELLEFWMLLEDKIDWCSSSMNLCFQQVSLRSLICFASDPMQYCSYTIANLDWYEFGVFLNCVTCLKSCCNLNVIQYMRLKLLRSLALTISRSLPVGMAGIHLDIPKRRREIGWNMTHDTPEMVVKCNFEKLSWITTPNKSCPVSQPSNCCSQNLWSSLRSAAAWLRIKSIAAHHAIVLADVVFHEGYSTVNLMSHDEVPSISLHQANPPTYLQDSEVSKVFDAWFP